MNKSSAQGSRAISSKTGDPLKRNSERNSMKDASSGLHARGTSINREGNSTFPNLITLAASHEVGKGEYSTSDYGGLHNHIAKLIPTSKLDAKTNLI